MQDAVRAQLAQLSADFYRFHAESFDDSRRNGWDSWQQILMEIQQLTAPKTVLDMGCGNGRFAGFLNDNDLGNTSYTGVDSSAELIEKARQRHPDKTFRVDDFTGTFAKAETFDLVVCFGVFHHLPGSEFREHVVQGLSKLLNNDGVLVISLWQPALLDNFTDKVATNHGIEAPKGLEDNDYLLGWKGDFSHLRYCHHFDDAEIERLATTAPLQLVRQFQGSGNDKTNRYLIWNNV